MFVYELKPAKQYTSDTIQNRQMAQLSAKRSSDAHAKQTVNTLSVSCVFLLLKNRNTKKKHLKVLCLLHFSFISHTVVHNQNGRNFLQESLRNFLKLLGNYTAAVVRVVCKVSIRPWFVVTDRKPELNATSFATKRCLVGRCWATARRRIPITHASRESVPQRRTSGADTNRRLGSFARSPIVLLFRLLISGSIASSWSVKSVFAPRFAKRDEQERKGRGKWQTLPVFVVVAAAWLVGLSRSRDHTQHKIKRVWANAMPTSRRTTCYTSRP